jgi:uncharacterized protein DUF4011
MCISPFTRFSVGGIEGCAANEQLATLADFRRRLHEPTERWFAEGEHAPAPSIPFLLGRPVLIHVKDPQPSQVAPDPWRVAQVQAAVRVWTGQLMDLGGRNTLLFYRDLRVGTLDVADADSVALAALLDGRTVGLSQLFRDPDTFAQARRRARAIRNKARELVEERGIETCFLAVGMASWENLRGMATPAAPVLLWQAVIRARGAAEEDFDLALTGELEVNPTLLHLLAQDFALELDADKLLEVLDQGGGFDPVPVFEQLEGRPPGWCGALRCGGGWCSAPSATPSCRWSPTCRPARRCWLAMR